MDLETAKKKLKNSESVDDVPLEALKASGFLLGWNARGEADAKIVRNEEEPKADELPEGALEVFLKSPAHALIGAIAATKKSIEEEILKLQEKDGK